MSTPTLEPGGGTLAIGPLVSAALRDLTDDIQGYALATLGLLALALPVGMVVGTVLMFGLNVSLFVGIGVAGLGGALDDPDLAPLFGLGGVLGGAASAFLVLVGAIGFAAAALAPVNASLTRAIAARQRGEAPLTFSSGFATIGEAPFASVLAAGIVAAASLFGMLFCYVGALVPAALFAFVPAMVALHRRGVLDALTRCARHAAAHPGEHLVFAVVYMLVSMVAANIPVFGHAFLLALNVRAYRTVFGDGAEPLA
ncbi:MAG: hypothetical protein ACK4YP_10250 [Myxococcota bacterium]